MHIKGNIVTLKFVTIIIILIALVSCKSEQDNHYQRAQEDFIKYTLPDIKGNWKAYISYAFVLKKNEDREQSQFAQKVLEIIDPNASKWFSKWKEELSKGKKRLPMDLRVPDK